MMNFNVRPISNFIALIAIGLAFVLVGNAVQAQSWQPPTVAQRCPAKWGVGDQRGSGNHMKPETAWRAVKLIQSGELFELGFAL